MVSATMAERATETPGAVWGWGGEGPRMDYENPLDHLIHRFQHRWETNPQFRAAMSGVLGLSLIIFLCVGVVGVNAAATRVLGAVGIGGTGGGSQENLSPG